MKVNWSALGIMITVLFLGVSILTAGFMVNAQISTLKQWFEQELSVAKVEIKRDIIAQGYAFSKAESEKRGIIFEDLNEGYGLAKKLMEQTIITK